jgi:hypothetical protein
MRRAVYVVGIVATVILASCGSDGSSEPTTQSGKKGNTANANEAADPLEGTWHTELKCPEIVQALERAGVSKSVSRVVQGELSLDQRLSRTDPCAGVDATADRTLRFKGGQFALFAGDELGWEASYELIDENTFVTGPSEAGSIFTFDFRIEDDKLYTQIVKPAKAGLGYIATWESAPWERES